MSKRKMWKKWKTMLIYCFSIVYLVYLVLTFCAKAAKRATGFRRTFVQPNSAPNSKR